MLKQQLIRDEGNVPFAYQDSKGYWTIGVGFLIDKAKGGRLPDAVRDFWLDYEIETRTNELKVALPWFADLDKPRQDALINMSFNLGVAGLLSFKNTLSFIERGQYSKAAKEMLLSSDGTSKSPWYRDVGLRAERLAEQIRTGDYQ